MKVDVRYWFDMPEFTQLINNPLPSKLFYALILQLSLHQLVCVYFQSAE